jgi:ornithine cyclodeaminase/alanine dehydrogenase-like protein (mu-crystallin family)
MEKVLHVEVRPVGSARETVENADILITATTSPEPVFQGEWLKPGCHINAIGSNWAERREIDLATLQRSHLIVTDSLEQAHAEAGDFLIPAEEGVFDWENVYELGNVVVGEVRREIPDDITLYKGLGIALEDVATAAHVYKLAKAHGLGEQLDILG